MPTALPSVAKLAAVVAANTGASAIETGAILAAASAHRLDEEHTNSVWFAESDVGPVVVKVFVGQQADGADREWRFLNLFREAMPGRSPTPLFFDPEVSTIVMQQVQGERLADSPLSPTQVGSLASWLTEAGTSGDNRSDLPPARTAPALLVPRTQFMWQMASGVRSEEPVVNEALAAASKWMESGELETLLALPCDSLSRGDVNLANCLWDGETVRMIDFEDAGWNNQLIQLGDYAEHLRARRNGEDVWDLLTDAVGLAADERSMLKVVRRRFALFWLIMLLPGGRAAVRNPPEALPRQAERVLSLLAG